MLPRVYLKLEIYIDILYGAVIVVSGQFDICSELLHKKFINQRLHRKMAEFVFAFNKMDRLKL